MRDNITFEHQAQPDLASLPPYHRLRAIGHNVRCCCEACFAHVERVIEHYLPGFLPPDPLVHRLKELELENAELRAQNERLLSASRATAPHSNHPREPQRPERPTVAFEPVVIGE